MSFRLVLEHGAETAYMPVRRQCDDGVGDGKPAAGESATGEQPRT